MSAELSDLSPHEIAVLKTILESQAMPQAPVNINAIDIGLKEAGFSATQSAMAQMRLLKRGLLSGIKDDFGAYYALSDEGIRWLLDNEALLG